VYILGLFQELFWHSFDGKVMHIGTFVPPAYLPHVDEVLYVFTLLQVVTDT